ncbi:OPA family glycerol-3-phosphate transporter-like MFS transporter [Clostridium moniliforme]|uniref:OPA family glycerol-3-phosphate transporter-like MFS transporter n=1 Tax=Clostridium moniliforme TaxID=39489 RepID=A0ABS4F286_9CLOT|nr:MFS transporter [Clostridium moniliforme]MBP1890353.1 OPA family glycerol-3-phosphate transporter-like MFS transporter [Clostridium moniliforme]
MFNFFKPAPAIERLPKDKIPSAYRAYRTRMFLMMFVGYAGYYLVRKNFAIASPFLINNYHFTKTDIGLISTGLAVAYGLGKFVLGSLADRSNVKYFLGFGLLASSIISIFMGFTTGVWLFLILMIINGLFQAMGAPPCSIIIGKWFSQNERGLKMGIWNTSHNVGGGLIAPIATLALIMFGSNNFQSIFFLPAAICIVIAIFVFIIGADTPESVGLPPIEEYRNDYPEVKVDEPVNLTSKEIIVKYVLKNKYVWYLCLANIFVYLIRQGVVNWIPIYLQQDKGFSVADSNWAMFLFEYAAIPASILLGWLSDVLFKGKRAPLSIICMIGVIFAVIAYWTTASYMVTMVSVAVIGCFIYGPQLLIGMSLIDIVPNFAVGSAVGLSGLCAYLLGELMADLVIGFIADHFGWNGAFMFIIVGAVIALLLLCLTLGIKKPTNEETN